MKAESLGTLLNQNILVQLIKTENGTDIQLINTVNNMELCRISAKEITDTWINPGGYMNKANFDKVIGGMKDE